MAKLALFEIGAKLEESAFCKKCGTSPCVCKNAPETKPRESYFLGINEEKAKGKDITRCGIFYENKESLQEILKLAKKTLASGGSLESYANGFYLILQGKHKETLKALIKTQNFKFKK